MFHQNQYSQNNLVRAANYLTNYDFPGMRELADAICEIADATNEVDCGCLKSDKKVKKSKRATKEKSKKKVKKSDKKRQRDILVETRMETPLKSNQMKKLHYMIGMDQDFICECDKYYVCRNCRMLTRFSYPESVRQRELLLLRSELDDELNRYAEVTALVREKKRN